MFLADHSGMSFLFFVFAFIFWFSFAEGHWSFDDALCSVVEKLIMFSSLIYQTECYSLKLYELVTLFCFVLCTASEGKLHGLYMRSFCRGLDLVLTDYRDALLSLEQEILRDPHLPVSHLQYSLQEVMLTALKLHPLVSKLERVWDWEGGLICKGDPNCQNGSSDVQQESGTQWCVRLSPLTWSFCALLNLMCMLTL